MPFVSRSDAVARSRSAGIYEPEKEIDFAEGYAAGVGLVVDEYSSDSSRINNEPFIKRNELIDKKIKNGLVPQSLIDKYTYGKESFDYGGIAIELNDPAIKFDRQIEEERNAMLKQRREYSQDVEGGAPFGAYGLGQMTGYLLDPINTLTLPFGGELLAAKGAGLLARTGRMAAGEAIISASTEAIIQPLVYQHKKAIDSPYTISDSIESIATAALGAAAIGGGVYGIGGLIKRLKGDVSDSVVKGAVLEKHEEDVIEALDGIENTLMDLDEVDIEKVKADLIIEARTELLGGAGNKLTRGDVKNLEYEIKDLEYKLTQLQDTTVKDIGIEKVKGKKARAAKMEAEAKAKSMTEESRLAITEKIATAKNKLELHSKASDAEAALSRLDQGILPEKYKKTLSNVIAEKSNLGALHESLITEARNELTPMLGKRLNDIEVEKLSEELSTLEKKVKKGNSKELEKYQIVREKLNNHNAAIRAEKDIAKLDKGELPLKQDDKFKAAIQSKVETEKKYLMDVYEAREKIGSFQIDKTPQEKIKVKVKPGEDIVKANQAARQSTTMQKAESDFNQLENPVLFVRDGDSISGVNAKEYMAQIQKEKSAIEKLRACYLGE